MSWVSIEEGKRAGERIARENPGLFPDYFPRATVPRLNPHPPKFALTRTVASDDGGGGVFGSIGGLLDGAFNAGNQYLEYRQKYDYYKALRNHWKNPGSEAPAPAGDEADTTAGAPDGSEGGNALLQYLLSQVPESRRNEIASAFENQYLSDLGGRFRGGATSALPVIALVGAGGIVLYLLLQRRGRR